MTDTSAYRANLEARPRYLKQFDSARTPYDARNALGVVNWNFLDSGSGPVQLPPGNITFKAGTGVTLGASGTTITIGASGGGGGNVSNSGTPTVGQLATWVDATHIQGVTALPAANEPAHTGDVTNAAGSLALTIGPAAVSYSKIQNVSASPRFLGRITAGAGSIEELTAANGWTILGVEPAANFPALTGDVTTSAGSLATTIGNAVVTYAKMQNMSGPQLVLGRTAAGAGSPQELTLSQTLDFVGSAAQGDILYRGASTWTRLGAGTSGQVLQTQGIGANPIWASGGVPSAPQRTVYTSGSGTYTTPGGAVWLEVELIGGGGGGGNNNAIGGSGTNTTFGVLTGNGGGGGQASAGTASNNGGTASGGDLNLTGAAGGANGPVPYTANSLYGAGGSGGSSPFGGAGTGVYAAPGTSAQSNTGSGGGAGGASYNSTFSSGQGGGAGGYLRKLISSPTATYAYAVGAGGSGSAASGNYYAAGNGAAGIIIITAHFGG